MYSSVYAVHTVKCIPQKMTSYNATSYDNQSSIASNSSFNCTQQVQLAITTCENRKLAQVTSSIHSSEYHQLEVQLLTIDRNHRNDSNHKNDTDILSDSEK